MGVDRDCTEVGDDFVWVTGTVLATAPRTGAAPGGAAEPAAGVW
ncbi:hypothetical protein [Micromonospora cremea]|uniref:Uncharacterized protein n=1 Tax=Micromonospora cremea TaxID=709881 RepID=A0A1N5TMZ9_9ACTN|nr:hypothetical protein [Micromonospora cremea]SIM49842.1 hypothetical protein SAMN04489832_0277 [Micromonospora cremea]